MGNRCCGPTRAFAPNAGVVLCLTICTAMLLGVTASRAQTVPDCTITGTVYLPTGDAVAGASARLTGDSIVAGKRVVESGYAGKFVFLSVPPGTYSVTVSMEGFTTFLQENVVLTAGDTVDIRAPLEIAAIEGSVVVSSELPLVDTRSSNIDTTFTEELLEKLPTNRDVFYDLPLSAAGMASIGAAESILPSVSAYGGASSDNIFLVNGVNTTDPRGAAWGSLVQVNYNNVQEVKVLSLGAKAEYGSFSGAAVDVITKSGSNEFHGDLAYYGQVGSSDPYEPCANCFGADWLWAPEDADLALVSVENWQASASLGGPIVRDKLWFHAGFVRQMARTKRPNRNVTYGWDADLFDLKLTTELGRSHRAWLAYHHEDIGMGNMTWASWDESMVYHNERPNDTWSAQYQWVVTDRNIFGFRYLGFETKDQVGVDEVFGHPGFINWWKWTRDGPIGVSGEFPYVEAWESQRATLQADFTHYAEDFLGSHDLKFGVQYTQAESNRQRGYFHGYANFAYPYPWDRGPAEDWWFNCPDEWCFGTDEDPVFPMYNDKTYVNPWLTARHSDSTGAFVDDTWVVSDRVTLNLGLRYDRMTARYGEGAVYEMPETPADIIHPTLLRTRQGTDNLFEFNTWSPRIGVVWTLTNDGKTALRSNIGRYYAPMGLENLGSIGPDMDDTYIERWMYLLPMSEVDTNGNGIVDGDELAGATRMLAGRSPDWLGATRVVDNSETGLAVSADTTSPYTDQFHISVERQLGRNASLELGYIYKNTRDLLVLQPYNRATGEYWEWEPVPFTTWTEMETTAWQVALEDYDGDGDVDWDDAVFVMDNSVFQTVNADDYAGLAGQSADRTYHGLQLTFLKRYSNRWQMLASLNWSSSDGFAPRMVSQDWFVDGPIAMTRPSGTSLNHFVNNTEGPLPMTPEWLFKVAAIYMIPVIETDFGLRLRHNSGRAIVPTEGFEPYQWWMGGFDGCFPDETCLLTPTWWPSIVTGDPNEPDWLPATTIIDLNLAKNFSLGKVGSLYLSFNVLNATNEIVANGVESEGEDYGEVTGVVLPRRYRLDLKFSF
jgi:outer membrane receptor protein involved in Fe transport